MGVEVDLVGEDADVQGGLALVEPGLDPHGEQRDGDRSVERLDRHRGVHIGDELAGDIVDPAEEVGPLPAELRPAGVELGEPSLRLLHRRALLTAAKPVIELRRDAGRARPARHPGGRPARGAPPAGS